MIGILRSAGDAARKLWRKPSILSKSETVREPREVNLSLFALPQSISFYDVLRVTVTGGERWVPAWNPSDHFYERPEKVELHFQNGTKKEITASLKSVNVYAGEVERSDYLGTYEVLGAMDGGGGWLSFIPDLLRAGTEGGLAIEKRVDEKQEARKKEVATEESLTAAVRADMGARAALGQALYSAQLAKSASAIADADPQDPAKQARKSQFTARAEADQRAVASAQANQDQSGRGLSPDQTTKRLQEAQKQVERTQAEAEKKAKAAAAAPNDAKKRSLAQIANFNLQAAQQVAARISGAETARTDEEKRVAEAKLEASRPKAEEGFLRRKVIGPIPGWGVIGGGLLLVGGGLYLLRGRK